MSRLVITLFLGCMLANSLLAQWQFQGNASLPWAEVIGQYRELASQHDQATLQVIGEDDGGHPIHLFVLHDGSGADPDRIRSSGKRILWITNGIHPGEADGIDASLLLARALLHSDQYMGLLANTAVCIVPVYNVSGALQRNSVTRVNQNGPLDYGFRGNALNLDLNRDFIKAESRNTRGLIRALDIWDPDVYMETHVSNGADHRYVMELLVTHCVRLEAPLEDYVEAVLKPGLYAWMDRRGMAMCPYFETRKEYPEQGLTGFLDGPRYSSGHAGSRQRIGILSETHMLKPFAERVNATFQLMLATLAVMDRKGGELSKARSEARTAVRTTSAFGFNHELDTTTWIELPWKGYAAVKEPSKVTGLMRLRYDRDRPTDTTVAFMDQFTPAFALLKPNAYIIPQAYQDVIERLELERIPMERVKTNEQREVEVQHITNYSTVTEPFEGHYVHYDIRTRSSKERMPIRAGDVLVPMGHATDRLVMEMLEPRCNDSFFAWGFFDAILQHKEWFSSYVFEDVAAELLNSDPELNAAFRKERASDPGFAADGWRQLYWIYQRSPHFEPGYRRYPVLRVP